MAKQFSTTLRNAWLATYESTIGTAPVMRIRTGSKPSTCASAATGTILWSETLPSDWLSAPSSGSVSKSGTWEATVSASGTAGWYEIVSAGSPSERHEQGTVTRAFSLTTSSSTAANSNVLNFSSTTGVTAGMSVSGTGVPSGATVLAVGASSVTLSAASTSGVSSSASIYFGDTAGDLWLADTALSVSETLTITAFTRTAPGGLIMIALGVTNIVLSTDTFSGGSWLAALPASNISNTDLSRVARSTDATTGSTIILIDHGSAKAARVMTLVGHNFSSAATIKWDRGSSSGGTEVVAGVAQNAWAFTPYSYDGVQYQTSIVVNGSQTSARYEKITIVDTGNADGYVDIGYAWMSTIWQPTYDASYGVQDSVMDLSVKDRSDGGNLWVTRKRRLRTVSFVLEKLSLSEGAVLHDFQVALGITQPILYLPNITSAAEMQQFGMIATLEEMSPLDYPYYNNRSIPVVLTELA